MNKGFKTFQNEAESINKIFPELISDNCAQNDTPVVSGFLKLVDIDGSDIDRYNIKIVAVPEYPYRFPHVFETGWRIPKNIEWHVYPENGHCCLCTLPEEILACKRGIDLHSFIENYVIPFFFNQKYREDNGFFLKERPHGNKGIVQFFTDIFKTNDLRIIAKGLSFIKQRKEPNRVNQCFCESGEKYRRCHREAYRLLNDFSDQELDFFINMIKGYFS